jgi:hypothetical protein
MSKNQMKQADSALEKEGNLVLESYDAEKEMKKYSFGQQQSPKESDTHGMTMMDWAKKQGHIINKNETDGPSTQEEELRMADTFNGKN